MVEATLKSFVGGDSSPRETFQTQPRVILIDDDSSYRELFVAVCGSLDISVKAHGSLAEMVSFACMNNCDFAVIDFHLEELTGEEIAKYADVFFPDLPIVLISGDVHIDERQLKSNSVRKFMSKRTCSPYQILEECIGLT